MADWKAGVDAVLGSRPVGAVAGALTAGRLRVLGYHGVDDADSFERQLDYVTTHFHPIGAAQVVAAVQGSARLPKRALWITFDDAVPSVVEMALPLLQQFGVPSTMFVCPGMVDADDPYWWETVELAVGRGTRFIDGAERSAAGIVAYMKKVPDDRRRRLVEDIAARAPGGPPRRRQVTTEMLHRYTATGGTLGNHTWDHPCLDHCPRAEVRRQIETAHEWMASFGSDPILFAYPNGNHSPHAEQVIADLGYAAGLLFDHRMASLRRPPLRMSRLRVNDYTSAARFAAIVNGVHPLAHRVRVGVRGSR